MVKAKLIVTKETKTGRNVQFQDTRNNRIMSDKELISRLKNPNTVATNIITATAFITLSFMIFTSTIIIIKYLL